MSKPRIMRKNHHKKPSGVVPVRFYYFANPDDPLEVDDKGVTTSIVEPDRLAVDMPGSPTIETVTRNQFAAKLWAVENWAQFQALAMASNNDLSIIDRQSWIDDLNTYGPSAERTQLRCHTAMRKVGS